MDEYAEQANGFQNQCRKYLDEAILRPDDMRQLLEEAIAELDETPLPTLRKKKR